MSPPRPVSRFRGAGRVCREKVEWGKVCDDVHLDSFFGLARSDYSELHGKNSANMTPPSASAISRNARRVKTMVAAIDEEDSVDGEDN